MMCKSTSKNRGVPLTRQVALTTVLHYRADCAEISHSYQKSVIKCRSMEVRTVRMQQSVYLVFGEVIGQSDVSDGGKLRQQGTCFHPR